MLKYLFLAIARMSGHSESEKTNDFWQLENKLNLSAIQNACEFGPKSEQSSIPLGATYGSLDPSVRVKIEQLKVTKEGRLKLLFRPNPVCVLCNVNLDNKTELLNYKPNNKIGNLGLPFHSVLWGFAKNLDIFWEVSHSKDKTRLSYLNEQKKFLNVNRYCLEEI